jgi:GntR family transcriptional regulator
MEAYDTGTMYITIDAEDRLPIYRQVAEEIKGLIARGELDEGVMLPPVRQVAADLGVNLNTIAAAYRLLETEGLVKIRHGSGAVVVARSTGDASDSELRKPLRSALAHLVLAGLARSEIAGVVSEELDELFKP